MLFGLTFEKLLILGFIAVAIVGPTRLPMYASKLAGLLQAGKQALGSIQERVEEELGPEVGEIDWRKLDPRQYDPRRIIRAALLEDVSDHDRAGAEPAVPQAAMRSAEPGDGVDESIAGKSAERSASSI